MSKCRFILIIVSFAIQNASAEQNNIWYFGKKAGLNFNSTANQPIPFAVLNSAMDADEGSASICDNDGNLLFYSNDLTVCNRNHQLIVNGLEQNPGVYIWILKFTNDTGKTIEKKYHLSLFTDD